MSPLELLLSGLTVLASVAALSVTDPTGDSVGDGTIVAPTAPRYANSAIFDLHDVDLTSHPAVAVGAEAGSTPSDAGRSELSVTLGAIDTSESAALGFGSMVLDVYLDAGPGGHDVTLAGPDMLLPSGHGWEYAVRVTPDGATGYVLVGQGDDAAGGASDGVTEQASPGGEEEQVAGAEEAALEESASRSPMLDPVPVGVFIDGTTISVELPWALPESTVVYALTGVHDPFNPSGWRPLADTASPWAYSGGEQVVPVIDLLAPDQDAQVRALRTGVLPQPAVPAGAPGVLWLVLMVVGVAVALAGLLLRRRVPAPARSRRTTGLPPEPEAGQADVRPRQPVAAVPLPSRVRSDDDAPRWASVQVAVEETPLESQGGEVANGVESRTVTAGGLVGSVASAGDDEPAGSDDTVGSDEHPADTDVAPTPVTGISAFDSYVLFGSDEDEDAEGFDELAKGDEAGSLG